MLSGQLGDTVRSGRINRGLFVDHTLDMPIYSFRREINELPDSRQSHRLQQMDCALDIGRHRRNRQIDGQVGMRHCRRMNDAIDFKFANGLYDPRDVI
ncbi:hypothetical protein D3C81_1555760 [compost metagenome]